MCCVTRFNQLSSVSVNKVDKVVRTWQSNQGGGTPPDNASELSGSCTNMTFYSDGMSKHDRSELTFDVINEQGKLIVCGWIRLLVPSGPNVVSRLPSHAKMKFFAIS